MEVLTKKDLEMKLGYRFRDITYLEEALTHSSCGARSALKSNETRVDDILYGNISLSVLNNSSELISYPGSFSRRSRSMISSNNERLEFLGDAVLDLVISEHLFRRLVSEEGELTRLRALIVCEESLVICGKKLGIGEYISLSAGEEKSGGRKKKSIIADAVEAVIGAVFIDGGFENARKIVLKLFKYRIEDVLDGKIYSDYKSKLQELLQENKKNGRLLEYRIISEKGPDHDKTFKIGVFYKGEKIGQGTGRTKKEAEQNAAMQALEHGGSDVF